MRTIFRLHALWLAAAAAVCLGFTGPVPAADKTLVAAASSLNGVLPALNQAFNEHTGNQVRISYGSSGSLARQITQGAPYELFLSADESYIAALKERGLTQGGGDVYAVGRLVLFLPNDSPLAGDPTLADLSSAIEDGRLDRLAIANPTHAPYGRAAKEVLQRQGLWQSIQNKLLLGENVSQAAQFTVSGADAGIISHSVAMELTESGKGTYVLLPQSSHSPLRHYMTLLKPAGKVANAMYDYLLQSEAQYILGKFGFSRSITPQ